MEPYWTPTKTGYYNYWRLPTYNHPKLTFTEKIQNKKIPKTNHKFDKILICNWFLI